ncbi:MAG: TrmH family RNA methyltransferase [bacterium]
MKKEVVKQNQIELVLLDIRSTYNVGAMFRTADAVGVSKIILAGITPAPLDRFGRPRADIAKSALGSEKTMPWESVTNIVSRINQLKKKGYKIIAIEQSKDSIDYKKITPTGNVAVIMGNEVSGVPKKILNKCDIVAEIPMRGMKESLNVSVSCGIALFRMFDK